MFTSNSSIIEVDSSTVKFCFNEIYDVPVSYLSYGIIDKSYVEPVISSYGYSIFEEMPLTGNVQDALVKSCGPYKLEYYNQNSEETLLTPNKYWLGDMITNNLTFIKEENPLTAYNNLLAGSIDVLDNGYTDFLINYIDETSADIQIKYVDVPACYELAVNMRHPVFGTGILTPVGTSESARLMRQGISHIIPREIICNNILKGLGIPAASYIPKACVGHNNEFIPHIYNQSAAYEFCEYSGYQVLCTNPSTTETGVRGTLVVAVITLISLAHLIRDYSKKSN